MFGDGWDPHGEAGFVDILDCVREVEFRTGFAEAGAVLGCNIDRDVEDGGGFYHFLGGVDAGRVEQLVMYLIVGEEGKGIDRRMAQEHYTFSYSQIGPRNFSWRSHILHSISSRYNVL